MFGIPIWQWFVAGVVSSVIALIPGIGILGQIGVVVTGTVLFLWLVKMYFGGGSSNNYPGTTGHDRALRNRDRNF